MERWWGGGPERRQKDKAPKMEGKRHFVKKEGKLGGKEKGARAPRHATPHACSTTTRQPQQRLALALLLLLLLLCLGPGP